MFYITPNLSFNQVQFPYPTTFEIEVHKGNVPNTQIIVKDGINFDFDTGTVPEDIWDGGGVYTGFPTGAADTFFAVSTNAGDTGTLYIYYLANANSTDYQLGSVVINGTTPVNTGITGIRCNYAYYQNASSTTFNLGNIRLYHQLSPTTIFFNMPIGYSQSFCSAITIPKGCVGFIYDGVSSIRGSTQSGIYADGVTWVRKFGGSPMLSNAYSFNNNNAWVQYLNYCIAIPENTDFIPRIISVSTNNTIIQSQYRIVIQRIS